MDDRITDGITHMAEAGRTDDQQANDESNDRNRRVVRLGIALSEVFTQAPSKAKTVKELPEELKSAVGGGSMTGEAEGEISLDRSAEKAFSMSHRECPFGSSEEWLQTPFLYDRNSLPARQKADSFASAAFFFRSVLTDRG
jgi:hypothetical protein